MSRAAGSSPSHAATAAVPPRLECRGICKRFGGEVALENVHLELRAGEVHGLVGSNGAGKSTLMKILAGALPDYEGTICCDSQEVRLHSPQAALAHGVAMVYQELSGIGPLSVAENLCLGRQPTTRWRRIDWRRLRSQAREYLRELEIDVDVDVRLDRCPLAVRQMVEIARGLHSGAGVLILDEPTSALSPPETRRLFALIQRMRERGVTVVFISHFLEDVLAICDRVSILKDGKLLETRPAAELDKHYVIRTMLGHGLAGTETGYETSVTLPPASSEPPRLVAEGLSSPGGFADVSLSVAPGECLGLYGFVGSGHQELAHALAGARRSSGTLRLDQDVLRTGDVHQAVRRGLVLVAADRGRTLFARGTLAQNVTLAHLKRQMGEWLTRAREERLVRPLLAQVGCRPPEPTLLARQLSGGNQQKVVFARWLLGPVRALVLDEPTRGMDVGAKEEILALVQQLKRAGAAVVLSSSEPELLLAHADRIVVLRRGRITQEFRQTTIDKQALIACA